MRSSSRHDGRRLDEQELSVCVKPCVSERGVVVVSVAGQRRSARSG